MLEKLKEEVLEANRELGRSGLVVLTWGNVSGMDRDTGLMVVKGSGIPYDTMELDDLVVLNRTGDVVEGRRNPSSDTRTHLVLYGSFLDIGGIAHAHSPYATVFAQACREIPCLGTTHADHFRGPVPLARALTTTEVGQDYTGNTGKVIAERFAGQNPSEIPGVLVAHHGSFTWGASPREALRNSVALEAIARIAHHALLMDPGASSLPRHILERHFQRKHGPNATYGQT